MAGVPVMLAVALVVLALNYDVGRPWRLPYPFVVQMGTTSLLFEVAACVALYLTVLFLEYSPAALEWLGLKRLRNVLVKITMVLTIFGVVLSTLHQSSLGSLLVVFGTQINPLWQTLLLPLIYLMTAITVTGSVVIEQIYGLRLEEESFAMIGFDPMYFVFLAPALLLSLWASFRTKAVSPAAALLIFS